MESTQSSFSDDNAQRAHNVARKLFDGLNSIIKGRDDTIKLVTTALLADGHVLLEDYPGSGKTTLSKALGRLISKGSSNADYILPFRRIQFTPDMLPGDVLGVNVFEPKTASFRFLHGPIFAHILLADEINRTGPKVQAAFLECMAEKQVTIDNATYPLDQLFFVLGTQNPLDVAGTYPLPIVQLDRFIFKLPMTYVDAMTESIILEQHAQIEENSQSLDPVCSRDDILEARKVVKDVFISPTMRNAIVDIVQATRNNSLLQFGASTRAALMLQQALRAWAIVNGRDYVNEDDLKYIAPFVLLHRLKFHGGAGDPKEALIDLMNPVLEKLIRAAV
ncbi:MAG: MoxR family ATPase [Deltaproteobacteria bacterium]|nr:MoxR family ATPase [Deltaproteobacteria bacterium]